MEIRKNPLLKRERGKNYNLLNKYDIIIVDEAHEHNKNMDLILSMSRNSCHHNNSLRLVILSATIDEDEPTYRRFYRNINDNKLYPLNRYIEEKKLDRINIDRRVHIAKPNQGTNYEIKEIYKPEIKNDQIDSFVSKIMNENLGLDYYFNQEKVK